MCYICGNDCNKSHVVRVKVEVNEKKKFGIMVCVSDFFFNELTTSIFRQLVVRTIPPTAAHWRHLLTDSGHSTACVGGWLMH